MTTSEYDLVQNPILGALAQWHFVHEYTNSNPANASPPIPIALCILPIVFHKDSVQLLCNRHLQGGLLNAIAEDRTLGVGLVDRIQDMYEESFAALEIGISTGLLAIEDQGNLTLGPVSAKVYRGGPNNSKILRTAKRLGHWFATRPLAETCSLLRITF